MQITKTVVLSNTAQTTAFNPAVPSVVCPPPSLKTICKRVNQHIHDIDVAKQLEHLRTLRIQGRWLDWSRHMHQDFSWQHLIHNWSDAKLHFALQATTNTSPTATNLRRWGVSEVDPACILCGKPATSCGVLNASPAALHQERYPWRHNSVLTAIRHRLSAFLEQCNNVHTSHCAGNHCHKRKSEVHSVCASRSKHFFFKRAIGHFFMI